MKRPGGCSKTVSIYFDYLEAEVQRLEGEMQADTLNWAHTFKMESMKLDHFQKREAELLVEVHTWNWPHRNVPGGSST